MRARVRIRVYGLVQGVGFRAWVARKATSMGIDGYVRNEADGTVLVEAEGEREALERLVEQCRRGPPAARVERVEVEWGESIGEFRGFEVRW
ncbi:MAG: acylphosphatase [Acidilobaceae archaeon]|nr:acylphosphatase [Acidilobaceae archaeon]MCX8165229.1 acylphosphatase [Acidilobaceae archaeon]MDW7973655.1 acylphosphatase [Sulfolobales archaeon]